MSTGQETVQPNPSDPTLQQHPDPATASAAQGEGAPAIVDVDDAELTAALAEVHAEEAPASPQVAGGAAPAPQTFAPKDTPASPTPMIPKPRFDEVAKERERLATENAYLKGQIDARAATVQPAAAPAAPVQVTAEQHLTAIANANDVLAKRFDDGEITMQEYKREERKLNDAARAVRDQQLLALVQPQQPAAAPQQSDDLYLKSVTAQLENQHPWTQVFEQAAAKSDWAYVEQRARENLAERGIDTVANKDAETTYELRKEVAKLCDELGPTLVGAKATAKGIQLPGTPTPPQQQQTPQQPRLSATAQQRQAALTKAAGAPPDLAALTGHAGNPGGLPTDQSLDTMDEDAIGALPASVRKKLMGLTA